MEVERQEIKNLIKKISDDRGIKYSKQITRFHYNAPINTALAMYEHIAKKNYEHEFEITAENKPYYEFIVCYALGYQNLEKYADIAPMASINKGLGVMGNTGSGKSLMMQVFKEFCKIDNMKYAVGGRICRFTPVMLSARRIVNEFNSQGYAALDTVTNYDSLIIDDLGAENQTAKYYGSEIQVIEYVIEERYSKGLMTHFTSNMNMHQITEVYGERVRSRLFEKTNLIKMVIPDHRMKGIENN